MKQLEGIREAGRPTPSVNQIELNAFHQQRNIVDYCHKHDIAVMGHSPMVRGQKLDDVKLTSIAIRLKCTMTLSSIHCISGWPNKK